MTLHVLPSGSYRLVASAVEVEAGHTQSRETPVCLITERLLVEIRQGSNVGGIRAVSRHYSSALSTVVKRASTALSSSRAASRRTRSAHSMLPNLAHSAQHPSLVHLHRPLTSLGRSLSAADPTDHVTADYHGFHHLVLAVVPSVLSLGSLAVHRPVL